MCTHSTRDQYEDTGARYSVCGTEAGRAELGTTEDDQAELGKLTTWGHSSHTLILSCCPGHSWEASGRRLSGSQHRRSSHQSFQTQGLTFPFNAIRVLIKMSSKAPETAATKEAETAITFWGLRPRLWKFPMMEAVWGNEEDFLWSSEGAGHTGHLFY